VASQTPEGQLFYPNGVDALTGGPLWEAQSVEQIVAHANREFEATQPEVRKGLKSLSGSKLDGAFGMDVDNLTDPVEGRWGVIFAAGEDAAVRLAVNRLIDYRKSELGFKPKTFEVTSDTTAIQFLRNSGVERGLGKVELVPYYLLIVGSPQRISFRFQMELNTEYATGRLHFDSQAGYEAYIDYLIQYEQASSLPNRREAVFWVPEHEIDPSTSKSAPYLAQPLFDKIDPQLNFRKSLFRGSVNVDGILPATKSNFRSIITNPNPPALLFTASHGMGYKKPHPAQNRQQGALLCQEYIWGAPIEREQWYGGEDIAKDAASVRGMVHFAFACYSAGTPRYDDYAYGRGISDPIIADQPLVSSLPREMLSRGALAFIGHVDRAWTYSFRTNQLVDLAGFLTPGEAFQRTLTRLLRGRTIGHSLRDQYDRGVHLSSSLLEDVASRRQKVIIPELTIANKWVERNDARAYVVLGDPAARLRVRLIGQSKPNGRAPAVDVTSPRSLSSAAVPNTAPVLPVIHPEEMPGPTVGSGLAAVTSPETAYEAKSSARARSSQTATETTEDQMPDFEVMRSEHTQAPAPIAKPVASEEGSFVPPIVTGRDPKIDRELLNAWKDYIRDGFKHNNVMFKRVLSAFMLPYWLTVGMYAVMLLVGIGGLLGAAYLVVIRQFEFVALFGGLSVASFLTFFVSRPLRSLEQNIVFITWLGIIYNTYWSQLMNTADLDTVQADLETITKTALRDLNYLIDKHGKRSAERRDLESAAQLSAAQPMNKPLC
jgi:hypothetical protein